MISQHDLQEDLGVLENQAEKKRVELAQIDAVRRYIDNARRLAVPEEGLTFLREAASQRLRGLSYAGLLDLASALGVERPRRLKKEPLRGAVLQSLVGLTADERRRAEVQEAIEAGLISEAARGWAERTAREHPDVWASYLAAARP